MRHYVIIIILVAYIVAGCTSKTDNAQIIKQSTVNKSRTDNRKCKSAKCTSYRIKNDSIQQNINIVFHKENIDFVYTIDYKNKKYTLAGTASKVTNRFNNCELGEDEEGNAYTVSTYEYKRDGKSLMIYIDTDNTKVTVLGDDDLAMFNSIGIMR